MLHVRIDDGLKHEATAALSSMGLSVSEAVRVFLTRVVAEQAIPFAVNVPNAVTRAAIEEARGMADGRFAHAGDLFERLGEDIP